MTQRIPSHDIETTAREFLAAIDRPEAYEDYNYAVQCVRDGGDAAWELVVTAVTHAKGRRELEAIGAALLEDLLQLFSDQYIEKVIDRIGCDHAFATAAATVHMTGLPPGHRKRINDALLAAGIDEASLVDWNTIKPIGG